MGGPALPRPQRWSARRSRRPWQASTQTWATPPAAVPRLRHSPVRNSPQSRSTTSRPTRSALLAHACFLPRGLGARGAPLRALGPFAHRNLIAPIEASLGYLAQHGRSTELAATLGAAEVATGWFERAATENERAGALPWAAHARLDHARLLIRTSDHTSAEPLLDPGFCHLSRARHGRLARTLRSGDRRRVARRPAFTTRLPRRRIADAMPMSQTRRSSYEGPCARGRRGGRTAAPLTTAPSPRRLRSRPADGALAYATAGPA